MKFNSGYPGSRDMSILGLPLGTSDVDSQM